MIFSMRFCTQLQRRIFMPTLAAGGRGGQFLYSKHISAQERKETIVKKTEKEPFDSNKKTEDAKAAGDPAGDAKQDPKKEPEQEDPTPKQEDPTPKQEDSTPKQEDPTPKQEDSQPGQDAPEAQDNDQPPEEEQPEKEDQTTAEEPAPASPSSSDTENEKLKADLLEARSQLAAYAAGVAPEMVADAVTLATAEAKASGEVTEEAVAKAMENVLKRHPEWKTKAATGAKKSTGGFKLGADPDSTGRGKDTSTEKGGGKKPWNKFNR